MTDLVALAWRDVARLVGDLDLESAVEGLAIAVASLLGSTIAVVASRRLTGAVQLRRQERLRSRVRPMLLEMLAEDDPDPASVNGLASLPQRQWRAAEPMVLAMIGKVRGGARDTLIEVLATRGTLARAARQTRSRSMIARCRAAEMLGAARREESVPTLVALLRDPKAEVRRVAIRSLGRVASPTATDALLTSISGPYRVSPTDVSAALVLLGPPATAILARSATDSSSDAERAVAAEVLGLRGAVTAGPILVSLLQGSHSMEVQVRAARALGRIGSPTSARPLVAALASPATDLRAVAARALGQLGAGVAVPALADCLDDSSHRVAANAAEALCRLGRSGQQTLLHITTSDRGRAAGHAREALALLALREPVPSRA